MANLSLIHKHSASLDPKGGVKPTPSSISHGEIAINYLKDNESLYIKNTANEIVPLSFRQESSSIGHVQISDETLLDGLIDTYYVIEIPSDKDEVILDASNIDYINKTPKPIHLKPKGVTFNNPEKHGRFITILPPRSYSITDGVKTSYLTNKWQMIDVVSETYASGQQIIIGSTRFDVTRNTSHRFYHTFKVSRNAQDDGSCNIYFEKALDCSFYTNNPAALVNIEDIGLVYYNPETQTYTVKTNPSSTEQLIGVRVIPEYIASQLTYDTMPNQGIMIPLLFLGATSAEQPNPVSGQTTIAALDLPNFKQHTILGNSSLILIDNDNYSASTAPIISNPKNQSPIRIQVGYTNIYGTMRINYKWFELFDNVTMATDMDGYTNTVSILSNLTSETTSYSLISNIKNFYTRSGRNETWYIPSVGELAIFASCITNIKNKLSGRIPYDVSVLDNIALMSSTVCGNKFACVTFNNSNAYISNATNNAAIIPFAYIPA